jgi:hypothetical protein
MPSRLVRRCVTTPATHSDISYPAATLGQPLGHFFNLNSRALMATITVLADMNTAPNAGVSSTSQA